MIFEGQRPIMLNGIPLLTERADLADRSITIHLRAIPETSRRRRQQHKSRRCCCGRLDHRFRRISSYLRDAVLLRQDIGLWISRLAAANQTWLQINIPIGGRSKEL